MVPTINPSHSIIFSISSFAISSLNTHLLVFEQLPQAIQPRTGFVPNQNHSESIPFYFRLSSIIDNALYVSPFLLGLPFINKTFIHFFPSYINNNHLHGNLLHQSPEDMNIL